MAAKVVTTRQMPDTYFVLVKQFPLTPIRDDAHFDEAEAFIHFLLRRRLDAGEQQYLDALTLLVSAYDDDHYPLPEAPVPDILRELMRANGYTQTKLARATGIAQSTISAVLSGERALSKDHMVKLGKLFGLPPGVFLKG